MYIFVNQDFYQFIIFQLPLGPTTTAYHSPNVINRTNNYKRLYINDGTFIFRRVQFSKEKLFIEFCVDCVR